MGFGWMFLGQVFMFSARQIVDNIDVLPDIVGYILMIRGLTFASLHCPRFATVKKTAYVCAAVSAVLAVLQVIGLFTGEVPYLCQPIGAVNYAAKVMLEVLLMLTIFHLSAEVGAAKSKKRSLSCLIVFTLMSSVQVIFYLAGNFAGYESDFAGKVYSVSLIAEVIAIACAAVATFSAYMWICLEGDEDMTAKKAGVRTPFDYYDRRRERERASDEQYQRRKAADEAGMTVAEMYGVKKKNKKSGSRWK